MHAYTARFAVLAMIATASLCAGAPPVFTTQSFADAKAQSIKDHKLLILDSMADWCGPCKMMDKNTWVDDKVVKWVGDNAIAVQFDVDKDRALATELHIAAMPTVIILKDGKEFDRSVGYQSPQELLKWLEDAKQGKTSGEAQSERLAALRKKAHEPVTDKRGTHANIEARLAWARALSTKGEDDEATDEFVWLWENMNKEDNNFVGVRCSFMASDMQALASRHPAARNRFTGMRDALESNLKAGTSTPDELADWIVLNEVVQDDARTVEWYERVKNDPLAKRDIQRNEFRLRRVFERRQDWARLASLSKDPVA